VFVQETKHIEALLGAEGEALVNCSISLDFAPEEWKTTSARFRSLALCTNAHLVAQFSNGILVI
jgi:hypothetical protein